MDNPTASLRDLIFPKTCDAETLDGFLYNFVSRQVQEHCHSLKGSVIKPSINECFAAIAIVDVSGFSKLAYSLAELPNGIHILAQTVKKYLDQVSEIILDHAGDIIKFIGDALIVSWYLPKDTQDAETVYKAVSCCMTLINELGSYNVDIETQKPFKLGLHIAVGSGKCHNLFVGDRRRFEHFLVGEAMSQVVNILDFAKLGELAISHDTLKIISTIIDIESLSIRSYDKNAVFVESQSFSRRIPRPFRFTISEPKNIDRNKSTITMMELFVDKTALSKFQADLDQAKLFRLNYTFSELIDNIEERQVTTVFIKVYLNICEGPERLLEKSQSLTITVLNSIQRWDGSLRQIHVDDKGAAILCFFGLPPLAHNDDAIRGMKMATEIQTAFKKFQTKFSISVSTGLVSYCGIGCEVRAEYAVVGDAINIAARLMCHELAKDTILCDECTYNLCKQDFKFKEVQDVMLKGRKKPLNVYVPKFSVKSNIDLDSERNIIGRENEKKAINKILESLESANVLEKRSLIISGESGQGLSRLVEYVTQLCLHKNIAHYVLEPDLLESNSCFFAVSRLLFEFINFLSHHKSEIDEFNVKEPSKFLDSNFELKCTYSPVPSLAPSFSSNQKSRLAAISTEFKGNVSSGFIEGKNSIFPSRILSDKEILASLKRMGISNVFESFNLIQLLLKNLEGILTEGCSLLSKGPQILQLLRDYLQYYSANFNFLFVLTNCHYIDDLSLDIFSQLIQSSCDVSFMFFTKPFDEFDHVSRKIISNIEKLEKIERYTLKNFNQEECAQLILSLWPKSLVAKVNPYITFAIFQKTKGNPFYTKTLITCMKDAGHFSITNDGEIIVKGSFDHLNRWIQHDERRILPDFDRSDRFMQYFLKIASVWGQCFLLEDIIIVMGNINQVTALDMDHIARQIHLHDANRFLEIAPTRDGTGWSCQFRSEQIRLSILSMIPIKKRQQLHLLAANFYESKEAPVDPKLILNHYQEAGTDHISKVAIYLELVAGLFFSQKRYERAYNYYQRLLQVTKQGQMFVFTNGREHDKLKVVPTWLYNYAKCMHERGQIADSKAITEECLKMLGDSHFNWSKVMVACFLCSARYNPFFRDTFACPKTTTMPPAECNIVSQVALSGSKEKGDEQTRIDKFRLKHFVSSDLNRLLCYELLAEIYLEEFDITKMAYYVFKGLKSNFEYPSLAFNFSALYQILKLMSKGQIWCENDLHWDEMICEDFGSVAYKLSLCSLLEGNFTRCQKLLPLNYSSSRLKSKTKKIQCIIHLYQKDAHELEISCREILTDGDSANFDRLFFLSQAYFIRGHFALFQDCLFEMKKLEEKIGLHNKLYNLATLSLYALDKSLQRNYQYLEKIMTILHSFRNPPWHTFIYLLPLIWCCLNSYLFDSGPNQMRIIGSFARSTCTFLKIRYDFPLNRQVRKAFRGIQYLSQGSKSRAISIWRNELKRYEGKEAYPQLIHDIVDLIEEPGEKGPVRTSADTLRIYRPRYGKNTLNQEFSINNNRY